MKRITYISFFLFFLGYLSSLNVNVFANTIGDATEERLFSIKGEVLDKATREPIAFAVVSVWNGNRFTTTDALGRFELSKLKSGTYRVAADLLGYDRYVSQEIMLSRSGEYIIIEMEQQSRNLNQITVRPKSEPFRRDRQSLVSAREIGVGEIERNPGSNRDISRVVNALPGVGAVTGAGYRNDLLVRGGSPSENKFYLDGIEIPTINHFSTQGASGGPVGIIDADLIREVNFYSSAFPANLSNALSSVMDIRYKDGDPVNNRYKFVLGASEAGFSSNGHLSERTNYLVSIRRSYLQFLFKAIGLPFLPTFTDMQFKIKTRFDSRHELTVIGLGGLDEMKLNSDAGGDEDSDYILSFLPVIEQEVFTLGAAYRYYYDKGVLNIYLSNSYLNNRNTKYVGNEDWDPSKLSLRYRSWENETKFRIENMLRMSDFRLVLGVGSSLPIYSNDTYRRFFVDEPVELNYESNISFVKYSAFASLNYTSPDNRFSSTISLRADGNSFSESMSNPFEQLSPRLSASYEFIPNVYLNGSIGRFYQIPPYTALGYREGESLVNKSLKYSRVDQAVLGIEYKPKEWLQFNVEGFYKRYGNMLFSVNDSVPVSGKAADFGSVGDEKLVSNGNGRSYGVELSARAIVDDKFTLLSSLTMFRSQFESKLSGDWTPQLWDNKLLFTLSTGYRFKGNYSVGVKYRYSGGSPYTPFDEQKSALVVAWDARGRGYLDYKRYNELRSDDFSQFDLRVDKGFFFKSFALKLYVDVQNLFNSKYSNPPVLLSTGNIINPSDPVGEQRYELKKLNLTDGTVLPTIGVIVEF